MYSNIVNVILDSKRDIYERSLAASNLLGMFYFTLIFILDSSMLLVAILPNIATSSKAMWINYGLTIFLIMGVSGNFIRAMTTNTEVRNIKTPHQKRIKGQDFCRKCRIHQPPRSHHCWLCDVCISKRDHHCFFMATCIGHSNQCYFIVYCFYQFVAGLYFITLMTLYLFKTFKFKFDMLRFLFLPFILLYKTATRPGSVDLYFSFCVALMYGTLTAMLIGLGFFIWQIFLIALGLTSHEAKTSGVAEVESENKLWDRVLEVFPGGALRYFMYPATGRPEILRGTAEGSEPHE